MWNCLAWYDLSRAALLTQHYSHTFYSHLKNYVVIKMSKVVKTRYDKQELWKPVPEGQASGPTHLLDMNLASRSLLSEFRSWILRILEYSKLWRSHNLLRGLKAQPLASVRCWVHSEFCSLFILQLRWQPQLFLSPQHRLSRFEPPTPGFYSQLSTLPALVKCLDVYGWAPGKERKNVEHSCPAHCITHNPSCMAECQVRKGRI